MLDYLIEKSGLLGEYMDEKKNRLTKDHIVLIKRLINPDIDYIRRIQCGLILSWKTRAFSSR